MRATRTVWVGLLLGVVGLAQTAGANSDSDARKAIQAQYDRFNAAYMKKDFTAVQTVFAEGCRLSMADEHRSMPAAKAVKGMKAMSRSLTVTHARTHIVSLKAAADGYEVKAEWTADSDYSPPNGGTSEDPARKAKVKQSYLDMWKKTSQGWQIASRSIED